MRSKIIFRFINFKIKIYECDLKLYLVLLILKLKFINATKIISEIYEF